MYLLYKLYYTIIVFTKKTILTLSSSNNGVSVFCTGKIYGSQDRVFLFWGGLVNYEELQSTL
jgi:hypothetical protein